MTEHTDARELRSAYQRLEADHNALGAAAYRTDEALAELGDELDRVREQAADLEADLESATHFLVGAYRVGRHRDHWQVWGDPGLGGDAHVPDPEAYATRAGALARARQLVGECDGVPG